MDPHVVSDILTEGRVNGIKEVVTFIKARAEGLYEWMQKLEINSDRRVELSLRAGELFRMVEDLEKLL